MPLDILLMLVVGGIGSMALAMHLLGLSRIPPLTPDAARAAWLRAYPDSTVQNVKVTASGEAARITCDIGNGVLWRMGADTCARLLTGTETATVRGDTVRLVMPDYSAPWVDLRLTGQEQEDWAMWMVGR